MDAMSDTKQPRRREWSRREILSFMVTLAVAANNHRAAEGYMLELLACIAFTEWDETQVHLSA